MRRKLRFIAACLFVAFLTCAFTISSIAAGEVSLSGKLTSNGKRIIGDDGRQYTIIPDENIEDKLSGIDGQRVKLTGVVYTSHGRNMITTYSFEVLK